MALVLIANCVSKAHGLGFSGARPDETDGEYGDLTAWRVVTDELGARPDVDGLEGELKVFVVGLRTELRETAWKTPLGCNFSRAAGFSPA